MAVAVASLYASSPDSDHAVTWLAIAAATVFGFALLTYAPGAALRLWSERRLRALAKGKLVLTYDDGPSPVATPRILGVLSEFAASATFFVLGRRTEEHPQLCDLVCARGHEIGSHSRSHLLAWRWPFRSVLDVIRGCRMIARWVGPAPTFRPPYGKVTLWSYLAVRLCGFRVVVWTIDTMDARERPLSLDDIEARLRRDGGGVVLMHDLDWPDDPVRADYLVQVTRRVLTVGRELGLRTCTMSELLDGARA